MDASHLRCWCGHPMAACIQHVTMHGGSAVADRLRDGWSEKAGAPHLTEHLRRPRLPRSPATNRASGGRRLARRGWGPRFGTPAVPRREFGLRCAASRPRGSEWTPAGSRRLNRSECSPCTVPRVHCGRCPGVAGHGPVRARAPGDGRAYRNARRRRPATRGAAVLMPLAVVEQLGGPRPLPMTVCVGARSRPPIRPMRRPRG
jgi:hypothetical protein